MPQRLASDLPKRSGKFEPRGAGPYNDEREPGARFFRRDGPLGAFERIQNLVADRGRFFDGLQARRPLAPGVIAVVGSLSSRGHNERVVIERGTVAQDNPFCTRVDVHGLAHEYAGVFLTAQNTTQRSCNFPGRQRTGGHLIKQWLKKMKISPVNQGQFDRRALQFLRRSQSAEPAAENDDTMLLSHPFLLRKQPRNP